MSDWRSKLEPSDQKRWDALAAAAAIPGGPQPEGLGDWDMVQTIFRVAEARGLLTMDPGGTGYAIGPAGRTVDAPLAQLAGGDIEAWAGAVKVVAAAS
ncbi:MAG: hypothetical protein ACI9WU_005395, partial [Myxococcota bacterium]